MHCKKAMVFAAGLGTRLRPLTNDRPKALVTVGGRTMLDLALARLRAFGVDQVIVNTHHYAEMVEEYLAANGNFGMRIEISREEELLDTGGGLKKAAWFFREGGADAEEPFLVHNVDVISAIDLGRMVQFHADSKALATLAVQKRETSRPLVFDEQGGLRGRGGAKQNASHGPGAGLEALAFCGIHVMSPRIFAELNEGGRGEEGAISIIDAYVRLAAQGQTIQGFRADGAYWRDLGRPENVAQAERELGGGTIPD
jgi:NDP-sugar pyrophosphorylase family protein